MSPLRSWSFFLSLALAALVFVSGSRADDQPKTPPKKDTGKPANPLQDLQEAFSKGVTVTPVQLKDLPKEITDGAAKNALGAAIKKVVA
jgi:hypothetical protein